MSSARRLLSPSGHQLQKESVAVKNHVETAKLHKPEKWRKKEEKGFFPVKDFG